MRLIVVIGTTVMLGCGFIVLRAQETSPLLKLGEELDAAVKAGDAAKAASFYADDAVMMADAGPMIKGRPAIQKVFEQFAKMGRPEMTRTLIESRTSGDLGFVAVASTFILGDQRIPNKGVSVWKRVNGQWKIAYDILNRDAPSKQ